MYTATVNKTNYNFQDLKTLLAKASPKRSGDELAGISATTDVERVAAQIALADVPLNQFLKEEIISYDEDEITRLIFDSHDKENFKIISSLTVGEFRNYLLDDTTTTEEISKLKIALTPEMVSAVSKLMRNSDLITVSKKCSVITKFRNTIGLPNRISIRLQPNHPTDDMKGISASTIDGLMYGCGDAVIGINPASDNLPTVSSLLSLLDSIIQRYEIPTQSCILTHVTSTIELINRGTPIDLIFQSIAGTELANKGFGIDLSILREANEAGKSLNRGTVGKNFFYFETGQGSALSSNSHHGVDQQTCEVRAYAIAREFSPLLINTVVGFIGPEYLYDGKQIIRAGLEDHFCGKLLGLPMGCDICYTNHAEADQNDMDTLLTVLGAAGCSFIMGVPGADDIMLNYQSTSFHDALYLRTVLGLKPAPEFEDWLIKMDITDKKGIPKKLSEGKWKKNWENLLQTTGKN